MKKFYIALWMVIAINSVHAQTNQIYKWTDANGSVHFSDKSSPGAEEIVLPNVQTYSSPQLTDQTKKSDSIPDEEATNYKISIAQPEDQATIRNPQGEISILVDLKPKLRDGDKVQMIFDDSLLGEPQASTVFALRDIKRGSHTLRVQLLDSKGMVLKTSDLTTIYMMPPRKGMIRPSP